MVANGGGSIVNLSSIAGVIGSEHVHMAYNASKAAVRLMTKSVAVQHAKDNIRANSVHPGIMPPMRTSGRTADPAVRCERMRVVPMRRPGEVDDVAPFCSWLPMNRPTSPVRKSTSTAESSPYRPAPPHRRLSTPIAAVPWYAIELPGSTQSGSSPCRCLVPLRDLHRRLGAGIYTELSSVVGRAASRCQRNCRRAAGRVWPLFDHSVREREQR